MEKTSMAQMRCCVIGLLCPVALQVGWAQETVDDEKPGEDLQVRGVFESNLPNTEKKHSVKAILHPHFGDLQRHEHLRIPMGLRYGVSDTWEVSAEVESYFPHGFGKGGSDSSFGFSGYSIGSKYHGNFFSDSKWEQVQGFEYFCPFSTAPSDITDGLSHFKPYLNFARYLESAPHSRVFWGVGLDLVSSTGIEGTYPDNAIGDDANTFTLGRIWEGERLSYTFEGNYATSRLIGENERDTVTLRPGIIWKVPRKYTFNSRGNWVLGTALKMSQGHDGFDYGISVKVRVNLKFKD